MHLIKKFSISKFVFSIVATAVCQLSLAQSSSYFGYSAEGKLLGVTSQRDSISLQWDSLGRNSGKLLNGDSYLFGYNGQGFLSSHSDPKGLNTQYTYNGFGFLTSLTSPDTGFTSFTTNLNGASTQKATSGSVTNITYDAEDRVSSKAVSHPTLGSLTYAYSYGGPGSGFATGNLISISARGIVGNSVHTWGEGNAIKQSTTHPFALATHGFINQWIWGRQMSKFIDECSCSSNN